MGSIAETMIQSVEDELPLHIGDGQPDEKAGWGQGGLVRDFGC